MNSIAAFIKLSRLPQHLQQKVMDFIDTLLKNVENKNEPARPRFGSGKGMFKMKPGFDEPLNDFSDYM